MHTRSEESRANRQCWECHKRRYACDRTLPSCKKCQKANKDCPGYNDQKPLLWIQPGRVSLRPKSKNRPTKFYGELGKHSVDDDVGSAPKEPQKLHRGDPREGSTMCGEEKGFPQLHSSASTSERDIELLNRLSQKRPNKVSFVQSMQEEEAHQIVLDILSLDSEVKTKRMAVNQPRRIIADETQSQDGDVITRMKHLLLRFYSANPPAHDYLSNETLELVQGVSYYNQRIQPETTAAGELCPNPAIIVIPADIFSRLPPAMRHTIVCVALNHFVLTLPNSANKETTAVIRAKVFQHRGAAIKALSGYVADEKMRYSELTLACILMFMTMELQDMAPADWRFHASGIQRLIDMRGGIIKFLERSPSLITSIVYYELIVVLSNTSSPAWNQVNVCGTLDQQLSEIKAIYNLIFPFILCPPILFYDIMRISQLRNRAAASLILSEDYASQVQEAYNILDDIQAFSPNEWAKEPHFDEWVLVGTIYKAAVAIYCIMSLQSLNVLPCSPEMEDMRCAFGDGLLEGLRIGVKSSRIIQFILWPTIVAGAEAAHRSRECQNCIRERLQDISRSIGSSSPLKARTVLEHFWERKASSWDECFDHPYMFVV